MATNFVRNTDLHCYISRICVFIIIYLRQRIRPTFPSCLSDTNISLASSALDAISVERANFQREKKRDKERKIEKE